MRQLRDKLREEVLAWERSGSVQHSTQDQLNVLMAQHPMRTQLRRDGKSYATELWFEPRQPEDLFAPLAHSAATLFATVDPKRVRKCAQCVLHFHDTSKKGTRRWVQHAAMWESPEGCSVRGSPTPARSQMTEG